MHISSTIRSLILPIVAIVTVLPGAQIGAQEIGGYTWSFLQRTELARETALAGVFVPHGSAGSPVFLNGAALAGRRGVTATISSNFLPLAQRLDMAGVAFGAGDQAGIGVGIVRYGISDVRSYTTAGRFIELTGTQEMALSVAGGLRIGPGAVGATIRYLRFDPQSSAIESTSGYAVDLSGTLEFQGAFGEHDWVLTSASITNVAGEQKSPSFTATAGARLGAAYLAPLEEPEMSVRRTDPTGIATVHHEKPHAYLMAAIEVRTSQYDPLPPSIGIAGEWALAEAPVGLRMGWNSRTDISAGFFLRWPENLVIDLAATRDRPTSSLAGAATLTFTF